MPEGNPPPAPMAEDPARGVHPRLGTGAYVALALLWTARAWAPLPGTPLLAAPSAGDVSGTVWTYAHAARALRGGPLLDAPGAFAPVGLRHVALYDLGDALLAAPLIAIAGVRVGYNAFLALLLLLNMLAGRALARACGASGVAAWTAGAWLGAATFVQRELGEGRPSQALLAPMALAVAGTVRLARGEHQRTLAVLTGAAAAWTALTYWYYGAFLLGVGILLSVALARTPPAWRGLAAAAAAGALLVSPAVFALTSAYDSLPGVTRPLPSEADPTRLDRGEFGLYNAMRVSNPVDFVFARGENPTSNPIAWIAIAAALHGIARAPRRTAPWLLVGLTGYVLSIGPWLKVAGTPVPMPFLWLYDHVPAFDRFWWPQRCEVLLVLAITPLLAEGVAWVEARSRRLAIVTSALLLLECGSMLKWAILPAQAPPVYREELYAPLEGTILTVPVMATGEVRPGETGRHLLWLQAHHGLPVLAGLGENIPEHRPEGYTDFVLGNALLHGLHRVDRGETVGSTITPKDVQTLLDAGFTWAVVDSAAFDPATANVWTNTYAATFSAVWGAPEVLTEGGAAWRMKPIPSPIQVNMAYSGDSRPLRVARPW